jgi:hypothetical protein
MNPENPVTFMWIICGIGLLLMIYQMVKR